jgi:hypothetical protein
MNDLRLLVLAAATLVVVAACGSKTVVDSPTSTSGSGGARASSTATSNTGGSSDGGGAGSCPRGEVCCVKDKDCTRGEVCRYDPKYGCDAESICVSTTTWKCEPGQEWSDPDPAVTACTCPPPGSRVALECGTRAYKEPVTYEDLCGPL